jgi:hypothetical protein
VRVTAVAYAIAIVFCSAMGSYIATVVAHERGSAHTDERIARLEGDLAVRRAAAAEANARRDQQLAEVGRLVCAVVNRVQPRDAEVERIRVQYRCDQQPQPSGSPAPSAAPR